MKICPQCQNTYSDDSLQFCLQDGANLYFANAPSATADWNNEPETVLRSNPNQVRIDLPESPSFQPPTAANAPVYETQPPKKSRLWLFVLLGMFFLMIIGGIGAAGIWMYLNQRGGNVVQNTNSSLNLPNSNVFPNSPVNTNTNTNLTSSPTATPTPKPTLKPAEIEAAKKEVESILYGWESSTENHNLEANLSNYADTVDYYKGGKINKAKLLASKQPAFKRYDTINIDISNMKVAPDPTGERATVTFDKEWDFSGTDKDGNDVFNSGKVTQQIILNKINGKWKIVSEKDTKVHYVDKGDGEEY